MKIATKTLAHYGMSQNPEVCYGEVVIAGTRIPPKLIFDFARNGFSIPEIISEYPSLTERQIADALVWCASPVDGRRMLIRREAS